MDFKRNNLDKASSPYLLQHKNNPVPWQEWSQEVLDYAQKENKLLFVSSGYSTCHWCHVMEQETFSKESVAKVLEKDFVCIKVDREERPDIDSYLMSFMTRAYDEGGWPLNVVLSPNQIPFFATTYLGEKAAFGKPSFREVIEKVQEFYEENKDDLTSFVMKEATYEYVDIEETMKDIKTHVDKKFGGFGNNQKFPSYNTLLFLLHYYEESRDEEVKEIILQNLISMATSGLYDNLQGGFYRYTVDRKWKIPHFEKMLYDQAWMIIVYSSAARIFKDQQFEIIVRKTLDCLEETFRKDDFYTTGHDADTDHVEGDTYLWELDELSNLLSEEEKGRFDSIFQLYPFEGKNHLIKTQITEDTKDIEEKLLAQRLTREQPFRDEKIILSLNSYVGLALIHAYRALGDIKILKRAKRLYQNLLDTFYNEGTLCHSLIEGKTTREAFLEDYTAFFLFQTFIFEEAREGKEVMEKLYKKINLMRVAGIWYESTSEIGKIPAQNFDHPTPSSVSMAEMANLRYAILIETDYLETQYATGLNYDFYNLSAFISKGNFHILTSKEKLPWGDLPINSIQLKSKSYKSCFKGTCREFPSFNELLKQFS